jgi:predicted amidohydrolase YtcJ
MTGTTIYAARKIITMNPNQPEVSHVAVRDGRVLGAGTLAELEPWGAYELDNRFADKVLMPGMIEGHAHTMEGTLWRNVYVGWFDRMDPDGKVWDGVKTIEDVLDRLSAAEAQMTDADTPLSGWSLDPIYMDNQRVSRQDLDKVSATRPVGVLHASGHILNVNSKALELAGLLKPGVNHPGIPLGDDGMPTGELYGPDAMTPVAGFVGYDRAMTDCDERGLLDYAKLCVRAGSDDIYRPCCATDRRERLDDAQRHGPRPLPAARGAAAYLLRHVGGGVRGVHQGAEGTINRSAAAGPDQSCC